MILKFTIYNNVIQNNNRVIIANNKNGYWIKISKEVYQILNYGVEHSYTINELLQAIKADDDREYMKILIRNMYILGLFQEKDSYEENLKKIILEITNKCNLQCIHCCISANENKENRDLKTQEILDSFDKIIDWNPQIIEISGGEPLLRKDFYTLIKRLRGKYKGNIWLDTNGILISDKNIKEVMENIDQINISLDGIDEETCALIRGKGVFARVIHNVKKLKKEGMEKITLSMVRSDKNEDLIERFYKLNKELGTKAIIRGLSYLGRGQDNYDKLSISGLQEEYIPPEFYDSNNKTVLPCYNCKAESEQFFIRANGDIYGCPNILDDEYKIGNILKIQNLDELKQKDNRILQLLNKSNYAIKYCNSCNVKMFCWTCPAKILELIKRKAMKNYCFKVKNEFVKRIWEN